MKTRLGRLELQMLSYVQMRNLRVVGTGQLTAPLHLTPDQERELFRRLSRGRLIVRIRRGLYLVPPRLPLGGSWNPTEALAITKLMEDRGARYQICGPNAFNRYGFDEQVPNRIYAYNNRLSGDRAIGTVALTLIKVDDERLGGTETITTPDGETLVYSSRARTLVDAVYDWARFNTLPRAYDWISRDLESRRIHADDLVRDTVQYGDIGTIRRMGALLEREGVRESLLRRLRNELKPTTGVIAWVPGRPKRGTINRRWGVVLNA
ncbi:MAG: hypothetical protein HYY16_11825 [Planctomycetes bacterium]|nr:hypothetical protein [Planctomycetota bacterium]